MLSMLCLKNFALVDEISLQFEPGFTCLTGETGAGKSLLADAIGLLLGGRASGEFVRNQCEEAYIEALLDLSTYPHIQQRLMALGFDEMTLSELSIRRVISREGRSRIYVNGSPITAVMLQKICDGLIEIVGQGEYQGLLRPEGQLALLDAFAGVDEQRASASEIYHAWRALDQERRDLLQSERERGARLEFLQYQIKEIEAARLSIGEEERLQQQRDRLRHLSRLISSSQAAELLLSSGEANTLEQLKRALSKLREIAGLDNKIEPLFTRLESSTLEIEDIAREVSRYRHSLDANHLSLDDIEDRLALIQRLSRKHGKGVPEILARLESMKVEHHRLQCHQETLDELDTKILAFQQQASTAATTLTQLRQQAATRFSNAIEAVLSKMGMPSASLQLSFSTVPASSDDLSLAGQRFSATGLDRVEFRFAPNRGEGSKPLQRIASGGELSRVSLAIKVVLAKADPVSTSVYDEVDSGVGGRTAWVLGELLRDGAHNRQVFCITHLPQVAAYADHHLMVEKQESNGRVFSTIRTIKGKERLAEIARMMGGGQQTSLSLAHAEEMLRAARGEKKSIAS